MNEAPHAERRHLTVAFIDIVGSTPLSERIDPEEFFGVIKTYRDICDQQIRRYGGHIARLIGDGLLAYFGVPQAHENDPERAVRASLAIAAAMKEHQFLLSDGSFVRLGVRIGVNSGVVVVGSVPGEPPDRREVFGRSAHVAARLQGLAGENGVVVGSSTYELTRGTFSYAALGRRPLRGVEEPVEAWQVEALALSESRFDRAQRSPLLAPMINRVGESALLVEMWQQTVAGSGQVAVISGEPGIGKSRLIRQFRSEFKARSRDVLSLQCSPFHVNTPLAPEIERLRRVTGIQETDDAELALAKLRSLLAREAPDLVQALRYYGAVLSIPACSDYEPVDLGSPFERDRAFQAFVDVLFAASRKRAILVIAEDVQWVDPTSTDLIRRIMARCPSERVMILITHRDDYRPDWLSGPNVRPIVLQKLKPHECEEIVAAVAGSNVVPRRITSQIVERTDGVPLFVEEYTRAVIDSRAIDRTDDDLALKLSEPLVPSSIHDSLTERLDRLGPAKRVAQIASVFGRQFTYDGILNVLPGKSELLTQALQALESAGIVYRIEEPQADLFTFKHAMIQDAAYSSLLKEERRELHARVASWLLQETTIGESSRPAVLGYHYARAGNIPEAIAAWLQAGKSALRRSATKEAVAHLREGVSLIPRLPASPQRDETEIALQSNLAMAYTANAGWSDPHVYGPYSRALKLCENHGTIREKATVLFGSTIAKLVNCELTKGLKHAQDFVRRAEEWRDDEALLMAHAAALIANFFLGRLEQASALAAEITARYKPREHGKLVQTYQHDPLIVSLVYSGHVEWLLGRPARARECCETARQLASEIGHPFMLAFATILGVADHWYDGDLAANLASVERGMQVADEFGYPMYRVIGPLWATAALAARGPAPNVLEQLCGLLGKLPAENRCIQMPLYRILLATEFGRIGQVERAQNLAASAAAVMEQTGERWAAPEIYRIQGALLCREPARDDRAAMRLFKRSLASARKIGAVGWELRTAISIARLAESAAARDEARDLLMATRAKFASAETSRDLREADELINALNR